MCLFLTSRPKFSLKLSLRNWLKYQTHRLTQPIQQYDQLINPWRALLFVSYQANHLLSANVHAFDEELTNLCMSTFIATPPEGASNRTCSPQYHRLQLVKPGLLVARALFGHLVPFAKPSSNVAIHPWWQIYDLLYSDIHQIVYLWPHVVDQFFLCSQNQNREE